MLDILINFLLVIHILVCFLLVGLVLMQRPKNEGLGAAFGGGKTENLFGAQTSNVLTKMTTFLATAFFLLTLGMAILFSHRSSAEREETAVQRELLQSAPAADALINEATEASENPVLPLDAEPAADTEAATTPVEGETIETPAAMDAEPSRAEESTEAAAADVFGLPPEPAPEQATPEAPATDSPGN